VSARMGDQSGRRRGRETFGFPNELEAGAQPGFDDLERVQFVVMSSDHRLSQDRDAEAADCQPGHHRR
jgi:hypothetical protein